MPDKNKEKVLIIILAETRAHQLTFDLFKRNLLDPNNADLALCVADNQREDKSNPFYQHAQYCWTIKEPEDWGSAFDEFQERHGLVGDWRQLMQVKDQWLGGVKGNKAQFGSAGILLFFRLFLKECLVEHQIIEKYDRFVVTRSDFMHRIPHVPLYLLASSKIWIPDGEDYGGYTDRHIVVARENVRKVLSIADPIVGQPEALREAMSSRDDWNLERYIKFAFTKMGINELVERFPYTMYSVRLPDGHTRWQQGKFHEDLGYYVKYPGEYESYQSATQHLKLTGDWNASNLSLQQSSSSYPISTTD